MAVRMASQVNLRSKGLRQTQGQVHKGCVKDAYTKLSIGTIPSNYESIIYHHQHHKGFGATQPRFYSSSPPDYFTHLQNQPPQLKPHPSQSIKGYGPFIATSKRQSHLKNSSPGPGKYHNQQTPLQLKSNRRQKLIHYHTDKILEKDFKQNCIPGPGSYQISENNDHSKNAGWKCSFETKGNRSGYIDKSITPGPGSYQTNTAETAKCNEKQFDLKRDEIVNGKKKKEKWLMKMMNLQSNELPGPGAYEAELPAFKSVYERIKVSSNFMPSKKDRFNNSVDRASQSREQHQSYPTPCTYDIVSEFDEIPQKLIDLSCFMSETRRNIFSEAQKRMGPNLRLLNEPKHHFHFNIKNQWL